MMKKIGKAGKEKEVEIEAEREKEKGKVSIKEDLNQDILVLAPIRNTDPDQDPTIEKVVKTQESKEKIREKIFL